MKKVFTLSLLIMLALGCKKEAVTAPTPPDTSIDYVDFKDQQIKFNQGFSADLNGDGSKDMYFYTQLVGDPELKKDYRQYILSSSISTSLPYNQQDQIPVLDKEAAISLFAFQGYEWYNVSEVLLAQKVIGETGPDYWDGAWKDAAHNYVPIQVNKAGLLYYGWIEISFDRQAENIILHKAAVSKEAGKAVKAGL